MTEQLSFLDSPSPKPQKKRLFFAVLLGADAAQRGILLAQKLRRDHALSGNSIELDKLHVTLHFVGDYPLLRPELIALLKKKADVVSASPFSVEFDYVESFHTRPGRYPLVMRGDAGLTNLTRFREVLVSAVVSPAAAAAEAELYKPHMTLFYGSPLANVDVEPIKWQVTEFVLICSRPGSGEPYEILGRWPLKN